MLVASSIRPSGDSTTPGTPATAPSSASAGSPATAARRSRSSAAAAVTAWTSAPGISMSCRARTSPRRSQIAPRRKRAPRSRPSTSAASCTGSKNVAPYFGPWVSLSASRTRPASSSDSSVPDTVGLEMPTRREISAREIGAPERIASSTVRSLRSRRSVGVALRANALAGVGVEHVRRVLRARPQPHALAALGGAPRLHARDEPRRRRRAARRCRRRRRPSRAPRSPPPRRRAPRSRAPSPRAARRRSPRCGRSRAGPGARAAARRTRRCRRRSAARGRGSSPATLRSRPRTCSPGGRTARAACRTAAASRRAGRRRGGRASSPPPGRG